MIFILVIASAGIVIAGLMICDKLIPIERDRYPEQWVLDRRPATFMRRSKTSPQTIQASYAATASCLRWAWSPPAWLRADPAAATLIRRLRMLLIIWTFAAVPLVVVVYAQLTRP